MSELRLTPVHARCVAVCLLAGLVSCGETQQHASPPPKTMNEAILAAIREPSPGQFDTPESVVRFLLEQVKAQDFDEAMKAFPIKQQIRHYTFELLLKDMRAIHPQTSPLPGADLHNTIRAVSGCQSDLLRLTYDCLEVDLKRVVGLGDREGDEEQKAIRAIADAYSRSRIRDLKIIEVKPFKENPYAVDRLYYKAMGVKSGMIVSAKLSLGEQEFTMLIGTIELPDNWQISTLLGRER